jgi:branched-chain amino acid transport system permease protein
VIKRIVLLAVVICLFLLPCFVRSEYLLHILILSGIFAILSASWDVLSGYTGIFSFGHAAFFGMGGYTSALLSINFGLSPWLGLIAGGITAAGLGCIIGLPTLRLRGPYVAIVTLACAIILMNICTNWVNLTNGPTGLWGIPSFPDIKIADVLTIDFSGATRINHYYLILIIMLISLYILHRIVASKLGLFLLAIRENEMAIEAMGLNVTKYKILVFSITSFFAGVAGSFYAHYIMLLTPGEFGFAPMVNILAMTMLGGAGTLLGPVVGSFFLTFLGEFLREFGEYRLVLYGLIIILTVLFMPKGILMWMFDFLLRIQKALVK